MVSRAEREAMTSESLLPPEPFRLELEPRGSTTVVAAHGDVDLATAEELRTTVLDVIRQGSRRVVLDLRQVSFIDSTGLRALLHARTEAAEADVEFALIQGPEAVRRLFDVTGTAGIFHFIDERAIDR